MKALTGIDPDRLPEERRGITIELGFAHLSLPGFHVGIVDVPGHEDFVKNMVAGVGSIDVALLIAADDGLDAADGRAFADPDLPLRDARRRCAHEKRFTGEW